MVQTAVAVPVTLLRRVVEAERALALLSGELEDFLLVRDRRFLKKMRAARRAHHRGKTRSLQAFLAA